MRRRSWALPVFAVTFMSGALFTVLAGGDDVEKHADADKHADVAPGTKANPDDFVEVTPGAKSERPSSSVLLSSGCLADQSVVEDLKRRRAELEAREKELQARETELKAKERAVEDELQKIAQVRADVEKIEGARKKEGDEKVVKLVETFETMSPKGAAAVMSSLDESLAVAAMAKIATPKLAKILNSMEPKKSARLSELLAGVVRGKSALQSASIAAATTTLSVKGGDKNDGRIEQQHDNKLGEAKRDPSGKSPAQQEGAKPGN